MRGCVYFTVCGDIESIPKARRPPIDHYSCVKVFVFHDGQDLAALVKIEKTPGVRISEREALIAASRASIRGLVGGRCFNVEGLAGLQEQAV